MRKMLLACVLLGGCATTDGVQDVKDRIKLVQEYTKLACAFVPTVATITAVFDQSSGQSVQQVGSALCTAVTTVPLSQGGTRNVYVGGVRVRGEFTNGRKI